MSTSGSGDEDLDWDRLEEEAVGSAAPRRSDPASAAFRLEDEDFDLDLDTIEAEAVGDRGPVIESSPQDRVQGEEMEVDVVGDGAGDTAMTHEDWPRETHVFVGMPTASQLLRMPRFRGDVVRAHGIQGAPAPAPRNVPVSAEETGSQSQEAVAAREAVPARSRRQRESGRMYCTWTEGVEDDNIWLPAHMDKEFQGECTPVRDSALPEDSLVSRAPFDLDGVIALVPHTYFAFTSAEHLYVTLADSDVYAGTRHLARILDIRKNQHPSSGYLTLVNESTLRIVFLETESLTREAWINAFRRHNKTVTPHKSNPLVICGQKGIHMTQNAFFSVCDELVRDQSNSWTGILLVERC